MTAAGRYAVRISEEAELLLNAELMGLGMTAVDMGDGRELKLANGWTVRVFGDDHLPTRVTLLDKRGLVCQVVDLFTVPVEVAAKVVVAMVKYAAGLD